MEIVEFLFLFTGRSGITEILFLHREIRRPRGFFYREIGRPGGQEVRRSGERFGARRHRSGQDSCTGAEHSDTVVYARCIVESVSPDLLTSL
jgi:hypothetical protein